MFIFLLRVFLFFTICHSENLYATYEIDDQDLKLCKKSFLVSGYPWTKNNSISTSSSRDSFSTLFNIEEKNEKVEKLLLLQDKKSQQAKKSVMTLCFKKQEGTYDHVSLVFEMFLPKTPNEISLRMVHYGAEDECCCGCIAKEKIMIDSDKDTLKKSYRAVKISNVSGDREYVSASYEKYASWIVSNDDLINGLKQAEKDQEKGYSGNCVKYAKRIMETVGLKKVDFGFWITKPENLKILVNDYIEPKYDYKH